MFYAALPARHIYCQVYVAYILPEVGCERVLFPYVYVRVCLMYVQAKCTMFIPPVYPYRHWGG